MARKPDFMDAVHDLSKDTSRKTRCRRPSYFPVKFPLTVGRDCAIRLDRFRGSCPHGRCGHQNTAFG